MCGSANTGDVERKATLVGLPWPAPGSSHLACEAVGEPLRTARGNRVGSPIKRNSCPTAESVA